MTDYLEENRLHWEEAAALHPETDAYDVDAFLDGESTLMPLEREEVGDVGGKRLLHLQCHFGLDTLSWAREGAEVTGVDFATEAIETARALARETGLDDRATFVESSVYDLPTVHDGRYDVVFTSYGVLSWLPDLDRWAEVIAEFLAPGGTFYLAELHPITMALPFDFDGGETRFAYPYFAPEEPLTFQGSDTYATEDANMEHGTTHFWPHSLGEILTAVLDAGLDLVFVREHDRSCFEQFDGMVEDDDGFWRFENIEGEVPLLVSVKARRPG